MLIHRSAFLQKSHSYLKDPYGLFASCQSQSQIYRLAGLYCFPDSFIRVGSFDQRDQQWCNGPLWNFWYKMYGLDSMDNDFVAYDIKAPSLMSLAYERYQDFERDDFARGDDLPLIKTYTGESPDLPNWLKVIDNAVNSQKSNVKAIFNYTQGLFGYNPSRFTWYLNNLLLEEVCESFPEYDTVNRCNTTMYHPDGEPKYIFYQSNIIGGANVQALILNYDYAAGEGENHTSRTVQLFCCSRKNTGNKGLNETFLFDTSSRTTTLRVCSPHMCNPALSSTTGFDNTLSTVWTSTLNGLIFRMIDRIHRHVDSLYSPLEPPKDEVLNRIKEIKYLVGEGMGNRTAENLVQFFKTRDNSTSNEFLAVETVFDLHVSSFPNHYWDIDTFMSIIENATIKFREGTTDGAMVGFDKMRWFGDQDSTTELVRIFLDALVQYIRIRRESKWNDLAAQSVFLNLNDTDIEDYVSLECMNVPGELLYGSKCEHAIETIQSENVTIKSLPYTLDVSIDEEKEGYVIYVGALVSTLLLVQVYVRFQQLPGGRYYIYDEGWVKRRREQVRMALKDDFLCREREIRARRQLGEEQAQEALQLLENAANREPKLPRDYQTKKRELSRKLVIYSHIILTLSGPLNSLQGYLYMESVVLCLQMCLSLLEIRARKLLEQPEQINQGAEVTQMKAV